MPRWPARVSFQSRLHIIVCGLGVALFCAYAFFVAVAEINASLRHSGVSRLFVPIHRLAWIRRASLAVLIAYPEIVHRLHVALPRPRYEIINRLRRRHGCYCCNRKECKKSFHLQIRFNSLNKFDLCKFTNRARLLPPMVKTC